MTTPGVSHPSPTTEEDFRRVLDARAVQPLFQPLIDSCAGWSPSTDRGVVAGLWVV
jgi:hypothetical protein